MDRSRTVWSTLKRHRLIALLNPTSPEQCVATYEALAPLGVVLEVAFRSEQALPGIRAIREAHPDADVLAGTVMTRDQAEAALRAGVAGVVSADYVPSVVDACVDAGVLCAPGGLSDCGKQLVHKATLYGVTLEELRERRPCQWVYKLFPALANESAAHATVKAWRAVYPDVRIIYAGGVTLDNVGRLARIDPLGIFCGSALSDYADDPERLRQEAERWLAAIRGEAEQPQEARPRAASAPASVAGDVDPGTGPRVVTFGEIMLRLSPGSGQRFRRATGFDATYGGAEANVAVALAQWGLSARYVSALPDNDLGQAAVDSLRSFGVGTSCIVRRGDRVGIYFLEHGASQRPSRIIYDRAGSAVAGLQPGDVDWNAAFAGATWYHWTGITPALSESAAGVTLEAVQAAKRLGLTVSVDLNYRSKLWSRDRARAVMTPLMEYVDVVIANEADADDVFGITAGDSEVQKGELDFAAYKEVAGQLVERFGLRMVAITLRESHSASENSWSACLHDGHEFLRSRSYRIQLVDRVGGGDAFTAGLIYALLAGQGHQEALEFGVAASCLKQTVAGDFNLGSVAEVERLAAGDGAGRIKR